MTSPVIGMHPSLLTHVRDSRRDRAKDLAALQAMRTRHRINHAASALRWRGKGSPRALALARCRVFPLTTVLQLRRRGQQDGTFQTGPTIARSGCLQRGPSTVVLRGRGAPFRRRGDTMVVSMASWAPWCSDNPSATTSKRLVSGRSAGRSMSRISTLVDTLAPASLHTRAAADSRAYPRRPKTPTCAQAARWWPRESSGRPHRQLREEGGKGSQRRGRINTLNAEESILDREARERDP